MGPSTHVSVSLIVITIDPKYFLILIMQASTAPSSLIPPSCSSSSSPCQPGSSLAVCSHTTATLPSSVQGAGQTRRDTSGESWLGWERHCSLDGGEWGEVLEGLADSEKNKGFWSRAIGCTKETW